jgi:hypothetical protein
MDRRRHRNPEATMATATRLSNFESVQDSENHIDPRGLQAELGHAIMRRLRRAAILVLDLRTEFEVLAPGDVSDAVPRGLMADLGLAIARRVRRVATRVLDPWTEFVSLD